MGREQVTLQLITICLWAGQPGVEHRPSTFSPTWAILHLGAVVLKLHASRAPAAT